MSDATLSNSSSADVPSAADSAATPSTPTSPQGVAAISYGDKREQMPCQNCGKLFSRNVYGTSVESRAHFARRKFCSRACSAVIREKKKAEFRLEQENQAEQPKSRFYKGSFEL